MGKNEADGLVEINRLGREMTGLSHPIATYVNELEVNQRFVGSEMDEFTKILPEGLEFLQIKKLRRQDQGHSHRQANSVRR
jgi:hypothetical protein